MSKSKLIKLGSKIIQGEFPELYHRGRAALGKMGERRKVSSGFYDFSREKLANLFSQADMVSNGLADHFKARKYPRFFRLTDKRRELIRIADRYPLQVEQTIKLAEDILRDKFPIFGGQTVDFGSPPNWFYDPVADKKSQPDFYADVPYLDYSAVGDSKIVWEMSRLKFVYPLGQAYLLTGQDNYALKAFGFIEDWFKKNPVKKGINWVSSLECAFRIYALAWMIEFFKDIELLDNRFAEIIWYNVYQMADHIFNHLSYYFSPNTHLTGEAFGLFVCGLIFPEFKRSADFRNLGLHILEKELTNQFTGEGIHAELSSHYHRYSADFYLQTLILCDLNNIAPDPVFREQTERMVDYLRNLRRPDGLWPVVGDSDGGKLTWLENDDLRDFGSVLSTASRFFDKPDLWLEEERYETAWLMGPESNQIKEKTDSAVLLKSKLYPEAGYAILRSEDQDKYLLFDCGHFGYRDCVHSHADHLSFELVVNDKPIFIDPGTYCYTKDTSLRNYFRSAFAHNVCVVNGHGINDPDDIFFWQDTNGSKILSSSINRNFDFISAQAVRAKAPAFSHTRNILRVGSEYIMLLDKVEKDRECKTKFLFHTPVASHSLSPKSRQLTLKTGDLKIILKPLIDYDFDFEVESGQKDKPSGWYSPDYGVLEKISTLIIEPENTDNLIFPFCIYPITGKAKQPRIELLENGSWKIKTANYTDIWHFDALGTITFVRRINSELHSFFLSGTGRLHLKDGKIWESDNTSGLYGWVEGDTLCLAGNISGKCLFWNKTINNIFYGDRVIATEKIKNKIEFEI